MSKFITKKVKQIPFFLRNEKGLSLIEVIIAAAIFAFTLISYGYMFAIGQGLANSGGERRVALSYAQETMERFKSMGFSEIQMDIANAATSTYGWNYVVGVAEYEWQGVDATDSNIHSRNVDVAYVDNATLLTALPSNTTDNPNIPSEALQITVTVSPKLNRDVEFANVVLIHTIIGVNP